MTKKLIFQIDMYIEL